MLLVLATPGSSMCVYGGLKFEVEDLPNMLAAIIQLHYILHIQFPDKAPPSMHGFLCQDMGEKGRDQTLKDSERIIV